MIYGVPPSSLEVDGEFYRIDSDFLTALSIMRMYNDKAMSVLSKHMCMLEMLYSYVDEDGEIVVDIPENQDEALRKALWFLSMGEEYGDGYEEKKGAIEEYTEDGKLKNVKVKPRLIDFEKDYNLIISAINKTIGRDVRFDENAHWWTFIGYCQELSEDTLISNIISIRSKIAKNGESSLDKHDKEFYYNNKDIIDIEYDPEGRSVFNEFMEDLKAENERELTDEELNQKEYDEALSNLNMSPEDFMKTYNKFVK